jgi:hypothetical protein
MVVAVIALVMSTAGTGLAASGVLIRHSSQIRSRVITGSNIALGTIKSGNLARGSVRQANLDADLRNLILAGAANRAGAGGPAGASNVSSAVEAYRKSGPQKAPPGTPARIATMHGLAPGVYAIFGKTVIAAEPQPTLANDLHSGAQCALDAAGDKDVASASIAVSARNSPSTLNMQVTRTLDRPADVTIECSSDYSSFSATDSTIIAIKVANAPKSAVGG